MKIKSKSISVLMGLGVIIIVFQSYGFTPKEPSAEGDMVQPKWANLKVLPKDITKDSLMYLMHGYENALSVGCDYCHAPRKDNPAKLDFASDDKVEKEIAREMMKMTAEINAKYFHTKGSDAKADNVFVINCVMCHRGAANPKEYLSKMGTMYKMHDRSPLKSSCFLMSPKNAVTTSP